MYLPSSSGDLRISNMVRDTARAIITNTQTAPTMIGSFSLKTAFILLFIIDSFYKECNSIYFSLPVYCIQRRSTKWSLILSIDKRECNLSVSKRFLEMLILGIQKGNPPGETPYYHAETCHWLPLKYSAKSRKRCDVRYCRYARQKYKSVSYQM